MDQHKLRDRGWVCERVGRTSDGEAAGLAMAGGLLPWVRRVLW